MLREAWGGGIKGRGVRKVKEDDIFLNFGHLNNSDIFLGQTNIPTDCPTDRQTDIVVYREVILPKKA